jgi:hypothetical protein
MIACRAKGLNQFCDIHILWFPFIILTGLNMLVGCSHTEKVLLPPIIELKAYRNIGVIEFSTNAENNLRPYVTQNFIQNVQSAQPGTRVLELGSEKLVLKSLRRQELDLKTIKSIGDEYNVDALILGHLQVSEIKPNVKIFSVPQAVRAKVYVEAALQTRILETNTGATLWTKANSGKVSVAKLNLAVEGPFSFSASDPKEKYGKLVPELIYANTSDFRSRYEYRKIK